MQEPQRGRVQVAHQPGHQAVAMVNGGVLYAPNERGLTQEMVRRHDMMARSRSRSRETRRDPDTVASSSAPSLVMLTSTAWPTTPTPAQPELLVRPVLDDRGPVGAIQAFQSAEVTDVVMDVINQVKPNDLVQVVPIHAYRWREVERIVLPPQPRVHAFQLLDMRSRDGSCFRR